MVEEIGDGGDFIDLFHAPVEHSGEEEEYHIDASWEKRSSDFEYSAIQTEIESVCCANEIEKYYCCGYHTGISHGEHHFGWDMSLNRSDWDRYEHGPYISDTQEYTDEQGWSDDKTEEKDSCEVKYHPNSSVNLYDIVKVLEKLGFFW